jgi:hypothetical protein
MRKLWIRLKLWFLCRRYHICSIHLTPMKGMWGYNANFGYICTHCDKINSLKHELRNGQSQSRRLEAVELVMELDKQLQGE